MNYSDYREFGIMHELSIPFEKRILGRLNLRSLDHIFRVTRKVGGITWTFYAASVRRRDFFG